MEDLNIPDISECSVAEKAHYFEEQIQKELSTSRPTSKLITQEAAKEKDQTAKAPGKVASELSSEKSERMEEEAIDRKVDKEDWNLAESMKTEKITTTGDEKMKKMATPETERKVKDDIVEIRDSVTMTAGRIDHAIEISNKVLVEKIESTQKLTTEVVEDKKLEKLEKTTDEGTSSFEKRAPVLEDAKKRQQEKTKIPSKIPEIKEPVAPDFDTQRKICSEFVHNETKFSREEVESALVSGKDFVEHDSKSEKPVTESKKRDDSPEKKIDQVSHLETIISATPAVPEGGAKGQKEDSQPSMIPRKIKPEVSTKPEPSKVPLDEVKSKQVAVEPQLGLTAETFAVDRDTITPEDKESTSPSEKATLKMQEEAKQLKKESRIPISAAKAEKEKRPKDDLPSKIPASPTDRSPTTLIRSSSSSASEEVTSPKREFESRIPKRSTVSKAQEKGAKKESPLTSETVTETKTTEEHSSQRYQKHTSEIKTKTFSKTFVGQPKDAGKFFEEAEIKIERDSSVVTSKFDHRESTEMKEVSSSDAAGAPETFVKHEETERRRNEKLSESTVTRATPQEVLQEQSLKSLKSDISVSEEISMSSKNGKEIIDAAASQLIKSEKDSHRLAMFTDKDGTLAKSTEESSVKEREMDAALKIERDDEKDKPFDLDDEIKKAVIKERQFEESVISEAKTILPSGEETQGFSSRTEMPEETRTESVVPQTLEERQDQMVKEVEARNIAETIIQSIQMEIAKRSASLEGIKQLDTSESDSKEYSENTMDMDTKESEVFHDRMADDLMKKFEDIIDRRSRSHSQVMDENEALPERLRTVVVSQGENTEKISNRGSISVSEDLTKDEESTPHGKEESFPSSPSHPKLVDRDITMSPSSISDQIDLDGSMESEKSVHDESAKHGIDERSLPEVKEQKLGSEGCHSRGQEIPEPVFVDESRQDSIDVPSLEIDEPRSLGQQELTGDSSSSFERYSKGPAEISSIHESPAIESLDKICLDRDITVSPSTVSEDTNIDFSLVQDKVERMMDGKEKLANLAMKSIDGGDIEGPPVISPRLRLKELEIKPVNWMIGDEKIEVSEPLQPSQAFDKELEEYQSSIIRQQSETLSREESTDLEQESGTRSSEDVSAIDSVKETFVQEGSRTPSSTKSSKFTVVPVSELDFETELVENRLDISCQELVDTLQREYEAKTPTAVNDAEGSKYTFETAAQGISKQKTTDFSVHTERLLDASGATDVGLAATEVVFIEVPSFPAQDKSQDDRGKSVIYTVIPEISQPDDTTKSEFKESSAVKQEAEERIGNEASKVSNEVKSELEIKEKDTSAIVKVASKMSDDANSELEVIKKDAFEIVSVASKISDDVKGELEVIEKDISKMVKVTSKISGDVNNELEVVKKDASEFVNVASKVSDDVKSELEIKEKDRPEIVQVASKISDDVKSGLEIKNKDTSEIVKVASKISDDVKSELEIEEKDISGIVKVSSKISDDVESELEVKEKDTSEIVEVTSKISDHVKSELEVKEKNASEIVKVDSKISDDVKEEVKEKDASEFVNVASKVSDDVKSGLEVKEKDVSEIVKIVSKISDDVKSELGVIEKDASEIVNVASKVSDDVKSGLEVEEKDVSEIVKIVSKISDDVKSELGVIKKDASEIVNVASKISDDVKSELGVMEKDASEIVNVASKISDDVKSEIEIKEKDISGIVEVTSKISGNVESELEVKEKDTSEIVEVTSKISDDVESELEVKEQDTSEIGEVTSKISDDVKSELEVKEKDASEIVKVVSKISDDVKEEVKEKDASEIVKVVSKISDDVKEEVKEKDASEIVKVVSKISDDVKEEVKEKDASEIVKVVSKISGDVKEEVKEKDASEIVKVVSKISDDVKEEVKEKDASEIVKVVSKISDDVKEEVKEKDAPEIVEVALAISDDVKSELEVKEKDASEIVKLVASKISREAKSDVTLKGLKQTSPSKSIKSSLDEPKQQAKSGSTSYPADTSAFKLKKEDLSSVDLSARYAITVLDQVVKKEIAEVKESLEAAKQDLIEELNENSETLFQIKDSPSEFQFKLEPETIPNDLPFLYKAPSVEQVVDQEAAQLTTLEGSPIAKPRRNEASATESEFSSSEKPEKIKDADKSREEKLYPQPSDSRTNIKIIETKESEKKTKKTVHRDSGDVSTEESYSHSAPVPASRSSSDVDAKDEGVSLLAPQPAPRRRQKPARTSRKVTSESDAGSSSGDSSNYQSCDYEIGSGSRPSSSDIEALQSTLPSGTVSEYETALMSIEHSSASRPTSQDYQSAASTLSSRESMKSLNSLSSGHLGSIDSTGELSETLVASEAEDDEDKDHIEENLGCPLDEDQAAKGSDSSGSEMLMEDAFDKIDDGLPCRMKRSSEMIFQQIVDEAAADDEGPDEEIGPEEETRFDECTTEQLPSDTLAEDEEAFRTDSIFVSTDLTSEAYDRSLSSMESKTDVPEGQIEGGPGTAEVRSDLPLLDTHVEAEEETDFSEAKLVAETTSVDQTGVGETMQTSIGTLLHQASTTSSTSGAMSFETVIEKDQKFDRHSPDSDSFELVDKPDIIDDFVVIEEVGREAEEFDSEGKSISIGATSYTSTKKYDREVENLITENKEDTQVSTSQVVARNNDLFDFESEESPPQASNDDQYSQSLSDDENFEGGKKWMEMQFQNDPRGYDLEYDRGRLEDIKEEEITDFEAGSSRFGSLGSHKGSIGSVGSLRGSFGSTTEYDVLAGKKTFSKPAEHDNISLSSLQEFEHLETAVAMENSKKLQCGSQESVNNGSLPRRYVTSRSGHGDDVSLSSLKDFEGLESICREAHLIELRAREEEDLLDHESPENRYKLENLPRPKAAEPVSAAGSFNPSTSGSDDYEKRIMEIDEIIRIAQANVEKFDRQDDTTEDISQIEITADAERIEPAAVVPAIPAESDDPQHPVRDANVMETSTDSLEFEENVDKKYNPLCRSSDSLEMKTTIDFPSLSSDSLNNVRDPREVTVDTTTDQFNSGRRISSDSLEMPLLEQHDPDSHEKSSESHGSCHVKGSFDESVEQTSTTDTKITNNGKTRTPSTSDT